ncbi:MAG: HD-GYP domain-containing protein [Elusimicrobia bacterium]|nr:HD-GYP domain-containing protein [Elusimicrobiota bacterium]
MPRAIHRTVLVRLFLVWLLLSVSGGALVYRLQTERLDRRVVKLALDESSALTAACAEHARRPDARSVTELRRRSEETLRAQFVVVDLYDADRKPLLAVIRPGDDPITRTARDRVRELPLGSQPRHRRFYSGGRLLLEIMAPLSDERGAPLGYFRAIYQVRPETQKSIEEDVFGALALLVAALLAAAVALYPVIILLNRGLARSAAELLEGNLELMDVLGVAIAERDADTNAHNYRVTLYAVRLGEVLGLDPESVRTLIVGAFLHDVGKIGIPDAVLLKPSALTEEEIKIMHGHVMKGVDIIARSTWLKDARRVVEFHHEKFDGSGYPKGAKGAEIPLVARIFAVADVFDALASRRPYKNPMGLDEVLRLMTAERGTHFDPEVLDAFVPLVPALYREIACAGEDVPEAMVKSLVRRRFALE